MVNLMHQGQQTAYFPFGKTFAGKPGQVVAGKVGQQLTLVLTERHDHGDQFL